MTRLKGLLLLAVMLVCANQIQAQTQMQQEFEKFLQRFSVCNWMDLDSIRQLTPEDMIIGDSIPIDVANRNMWYEGNKYKPDCIFNHVKNEKNTVNRPSWGELPPPLIRNIDGEYGSPHGGFGLFSIQRGIKYDDKLNEWVPSDEYSKVYPLAQISLYKDIVAIIVLYKYMPESIFKYSIDLYTYTKSDQQMCSAMSIGGDCDISDVVINDDITIACKEWYDIDYNNDGSSLHINIDEKYHISEDGYITEIFLREPFLGYVVDADGYVNVRESPDVKSKVLYTISSDSFVVCYPIEGTQWAEMWKYSDIKKDTVGIDVKGYIHLSRLVPQYKYETERGW